MGLMAQDYKRVPHRLLRCPGHMGHLYLADKAHTFVAALFLSHGASIVIEEHGSCLFEKCCSWTCMADLISLLQCNW